MRGYNMKKVLLTMFISFMLLIVVESSYIQSDVNNYETSLGITETIEAVNGNSDIR